MDDNFDNVENIEKWHIKLKKEFDLQAVLRGEGRTFEINLEENMNNEPNFYDPKEINLTDLADAYLDMDSDDDQDDMKSTPFEKVAAKMTNVTEDGKIKKLIKRKGTGTSPPCNSLVSIYYCSYLEYNDEPTDFAYIRKPYTFRLGNAAIYGLNLTVQSMKLNEKSQFLIHPDYAFGAMGHPPRIPPNATFLFQIELLRYNDTGPALEFHNLSMEEKRKFPIAYKTALALVENAKEYYKHNLKLAIREYNKAVSLLEECNLNDMSDQEKQQKLLFKLYTNLAVCFTKDGNPKRACIMCNNIYSMSKNMPLNIPAKVYFHNGRALFMLGEYRRAREKLLKAQRLEPNNMEISNELSILSSKIKEESEREKHFAKCLLNNNSTKKIESVVSNNQETESFALELKNLFEDLIKNNEENEIKLPEGLTLKEEQTAKVVAEKLGLKFLISKSSENDTKTLTVSKT